MKKSGFTIVFLLAVALCFGQRRGEFVPNYDESKVPQFELPNPLTSFSGRKIKNTRRWERIRRPELLEFFTNTVYGKVPGKLEISKWEVVEESDYALNGKASRKQVDIVFNKNGKTLFFNVLMYLPKNVEKAPLFLGYNFYGNHTVCDDVNIRISQAWTRNNESYGISNNQLTEKSRGVKKESWQVEKIIDAGYGLATIFYCEVDPDKNDFTDGVHPFFYVDNQQRPAAGEWGSIAAWAWGLSRTMDYLEQDEDVDASKVIVFGHSRLGKAALWAGATDKRFAGVISNNSGCGGAALSKRQFGETVARINNAFPHWFARNFTSYNLNEKALPVDQHELLALIAPRPVYVASAEEDLWADPRGEFLSAYYATPVYELYGKTGIPSDEMPPVNQPIINTVAYHIRTGGHAVTAFDWDQYIKWADRELFNKAVTITRVSIQGDKFYINGKPTFEGKTWRGYSVEGLLPNSRMVQGVFNEDDHFDFDKPENNFVNATKAYASWGYFDFRMDGEGFDEGYQSVPVNWGINSERKKAFFGKVKEIFMG
jgi:hypothetical protein